MKIIDVQRVLAAYLANPEITKDDEINFDVVHEREAVGWGSNAWFEIHQDGDDHPELKLRIYLSDFEYSFGDKSDIENELESAKEIITMARTLCKAIHRDKRINKSKKAMAASIMEAIAEMNRAKE